MIERGFNQGTTKKNSTLADDILFCSESGFDVIEIRLDMLDDYLLDNSIEDLRTALVNSNLSVHALNAIKEINLAEGQQRKRTDRELVLACEYAVELSCSVLVLVPTIDPRVVSFDRRTIHEDAISTLAGMAEKAAEYGINLALEPVGFPDCAVPTVEDAWNLVETVGTDNLGLLLDTFNVYLDPRYRGFDYSGIPGKSVFGIHVADADSNPRELLRQENRVWPGHGVIPLCELLGRFLATGYRGPLSIELFRPEYYLMDPRETVAASARTLNELIERCDREDDEKELKEEHDGKNTDHR